MKRSVIFIACIWAPFVAFAQMGNNKLLKDTVAIRTPVFTIHTPATFNSKNEQTIPQNYYAQHLGFFCKQELKMQQAHVPVTFRLGSMDYCNRLEQKTGYR